MEMATATTLNLNYNGLTEIDFEKKKFSQKHRIYLKRNLLRSLSPSIGKLQCLVQLHIDSNNLEDLPEELGELKMLEVLDVSDNHLSWLPARLSEIQSLQKLRISHNNFQQFPVEICYLQKLKVLEASRNNFQSIPPELCQCINLTLLSLDKNALKTIPRQLTRLCNLEELSLCGNKLTCLPHGVWRLDKLGMLNVDNNPLKTLPLSIQKLTLSCYIGLYGCVPFNTADYIEENIQQILPMEFTDVCMVKKSCVPCLQELAVRQIARTGRNYDYRQRLPLPRLWLDRLVEPTANCDRCGEEMFISTFPVITDHTTEHIQYCGLFCSLSCVLFYQTMTSVKIIYPSYDEG